MGAAAVVEYVGSMADAYWPTAIILCAIFFAADRPSYGDASNLHETRERTYQRARPAAGPLGQQRARAGPLRRRGACDWRRRDIPPEQVAHGPKVPVRRSSARTTQRKAQGRCDWMSGLRGRGDKLGVASWLASGFRVYAYHRRPRPDPRPGPHPAPRVRVRVRKFLVERSPRARADRIQAWPIAFNEWAPGRIWVP